MKNTFTDHTNQIEAIKSKNDYIQKSLAEVKSYIDKAKNLDKFKEKDVEFKAYFDNLDQIKNETSKLQANTAETLNVINKLITLSHLSTNESSMMYLHALRTQILSELLLRKQPLSIKRFQRIDISRFRVKLFFYVVLMTK